MITATVRPCREDDTFQEGDTLLTEAVEDHFIPWKIKRIFQNPSKYADYPMADMESNTGTTTTIPLKPEGVSERWWRPTDDPDVEGVRIVQVFNITKTYITLRVECDDLDGDQAVENALLALESGGFYRRRAGSGWAPDTEMEEHLMDKRDGMPYAFFVPHRDVHHVARDRGAVHMQVADPRTKGTHQ